MTNETINYTTPEKALSLIQSGQRIFIHGSACTPIYMMQHLAKRKNELKNVELVFMSVYGDMVIDKPEYQESFHINSFFVSKPVREAVNEGRADFIPIFLSEIPQLFRRGGLPLDGAIVQVSPPDKNGYCSLGASVDIANTAIATAKYVIAHVNPQVPRTHGESFVHYSQFAAMVYADEPLQEANFGAGTSEEERKIGEYIAEMIEDRSVLQLGIGSIPDAVLRCLHNHKDPYKTVAGFALGTRKLYDYIDDNPAFEFLDIDYVNDPGVIRRNDKAIAINSAIEVDITGQVCADSIGTYQYSGIGGQMDFMRGASLSEGGKPIIALTSRTKKGVPHIVPFLKQGAGVVTTRGHIHYVVTEYGIAPLFGKNLRQRAKALIDIAHPDDREELSKACHERFKGNFSC